MSTEIGFIKRTGRSDKENGLFITRFYGGDKRGVCFQLTAREEGLNGVINFNFIQLSYEDWLTLRKVIDDQVYNFINKEQVQESEFIKSDEYGSEDL